MRSQSIIIISLLVLTACSRESAESNPPIEANPRIAERNEPAPSVAGVGEASSAEAAAGQGDEASPPAATGPAPPRLEQWAFVPHQASSVEFAYQQENLTIARANAGFLAQSRPPSGPMDLVHRRRMSGDFVARIRVRTPSRGDPDVQQRGGTAIPYFGFRELDGKRYVTAPAPQLVDQPLEHELTIERVGDQFYFSVDGQPRQGGSRGSRQPGHIFLQLNPPAKLWITGFEVNDDSMLFDYGVPQLAPIDIEPERWVFSTGGTDPRDIQDPGALQLALDEDGLVMTAVDIGPTSTIRHLETFHGDFLIQAELQLPTIDESGGYHTLGGLGASIGVEFKPESSRTAGARFSKHLTEEPQTFLLAIQREGDRIHLIQDGKRVGGYRFPGSENPGRLYLRIGGVGSLRLKRLEKVIAAQPAPGSALASGAPSSQSSTSPPASSHSVRPDAPQWINLLSGLDPPNQTLRGKAHFSDGALFTDAAKAPALIRTSFTAPRRYELRAAVTRRSGKGAFYMIGPIDGKPCAVIVEAENGGKLSSGLALIDRMAPKNPKYPAEACTKKLLPVGKRVDIHCRIDGSAFELTVGNERVFRWSGDVSRLSLTPFFQSKFPSHVLLGSANSEFEIHRLEMRPLEGSLASVPHAKPASSPADQPANQPANQPAQAPSATTPPPVAAFEDWYVPASPKTDQDLKIEQDLTFARDEQGLQISKSKEPGDFWLYRQPALEGDFLATLRIVVPSSSLGQITVGVHPAARRGSIFMLTLPPPLPQNQREVIVRIQKVDREVIGQIEGQPARPPANIEGPVKLGLLLRDDVRFWISDCQVKSLGKNVAAASPTSDGGDGASQSTARDTPPIAEAIQEIQLPAPVDNATLGAGGRYLILHIKPLFKLAVFDIETLNIVGYVPVSDGRVLFAAGAEHLVVVQPEEGTITRWSLANLQRELTTSFAATYSATDLAMGSASAGPLVVASSQEGANRSDVQFFDLQTLKPLEVEVTTQANTPPRWYDVSAVRAAADGCTFGVAGARDAKILVLSGQRAELYEDPSRKAHFASPGPISQVVFTDAGLFNSQFKPLKQDGISRLQPTVPATRGPFYLSVDAPISYSVGDPLLGSVSLQLAPYVAPLATFRDLRLKGNRSEYFNRRGGLSLDRRLVFHPPAGRIVAIADEHDRLLIKQIDLAAILARADIHDLLVMSQPPPMVHPGQNYRYQLEVLSSSGGIEYELTTGPQGMTITPTGLVSWRAPESRVPATAHAVISIKDQSSQSVFHTFAVNNRPLGPPADLANDATPRSPAAPETTDGETAASGKPSADAAASSNPLPPTKSDSKTTIPLPRPFDSVCVGGGGRYLVFWLSAVKQIVVVDVATAKIAKFISIDDSSTLIAAGATKLFAVLPEARTIRSWSMGTWEEQRPVALPGDYRPQAAILGHGSSGPLLIVGDERTSSPLHFLDSQLQPLNVDLGQQPHLMGAGELRLRAAGDGGFFTMWRVNSSPRGVFLLQLRGKDAKLRYFHETIGYIAPSNDGSRIYSPGGVFNFQSDDIGGMADRAAASLPTPAVNGDFVVQVERIDRDPNRPASTPSVSIFLAGEKTPIATLTDIDVRPGDDSDFFARAPLTLDKRIYFFPLASTIATLPESNDRVVLHRIDLDRALASSGLNFLVIASRPPNRVVVGQELQYQMIAKSKNGGVTYELAKGPTGAALTPGGLLRWSVPEDFPVGDQRLLLTARDDSGRTAFQSFVVEVAASSQGLRTWTDVTGEYRVLAKFVKLEAGRVHLLRQDGGQAAVPLDQLSAEDQSVARKLANGR